MQLTIGAQKRIAWTDATGTYRFYDTPKGANGTVTAITAIRHIGPGGGLGGIGSGVLHGGQGGVKELPIGVKELPKAP